jgi:hypothetical protein
MDNPYKGKENKQKNRAAENHCSPQTEHQYKKTKYSTENFGK